MRLQRRILIIDDSVEDRGVFRRFLQLDPQYNNHVEERGTGEEGIEACLRTGFDAVLLDHHMPRMQGLEVLRTLRAIPGWKTPVIALTNTRREEVAERMLEEGAHDFLFKDDLTASLLSRAISNAVTKARLQRKVERSVRRTALLQKVTAELAKAVTQAEMVQSFMSHGLEAVGAHGGLVTFVSAEGTQLDIAASPGFSEAEVDGWMHIPLSAALPITDAARTGALITLGSLEERLARYPTLKLSRYQALAAVPLRVGDKRIGALGFAFTEPHVFDEEERNLLLVLSRLCAQSLERARLFEALAESEAQRRFALEAVRMGTWTWEAHSDAVLMDATARSLFCLPPEGPLDSQCVSPRLLDKEVLAAREPSAQAGALPSPYEREVHVLDPAGAPRWIMAKGHVTRDEQGRTVRMVGVCYDRTERKGFEQGLMLQRETEKQRADFEQLLMGIVSHDLKNPLAAILMQVALGLRQGGLEERHTKVLTRIHSAADRANRMINDLLDFTQARLGGGIPVNLRALNAREVVEQVLEEVRQAYPQRELTFECEGDTTGRWDGDRLGQVVTNLLQNAVKYSPEDTGIQVRLRSLGAQVELEVLNQGAPIDEQSLPHLFEPMQRASSLVESKADRSVGLGLYIVKQVVEAHKGTVAVQSRQGEGTRFTVHLPR